MGQLITTLSGSGVTTFGGVIQPQEIAIRMTLAGGLVNFNGVLSSGFERIHQAGWVGVGQDVSGVSPPYLITWSEFLKHPWESWRFPPVFYADVYLWDLTPGTEVELEVDW